MKKCKQFLALLLVLCMTLSVVPFGAFADDSEPAAESTGTVVDESEPAGDSQDPDESEAPEDSTGASNEDPEDSEDPKDPVDSTETSTDPQADPTGEGPSMDENEDEDEDLDAQSVEAATLTASLADTYRILHLDCGRKYFTKDWIIALINEMSEAGYTHLELAFGNDGLRFLLSDMSVTVGETTYTSDAVKSAIRSGNNARYGETDALTQTEMNEIIAHAKAKGIGIIPLLNTPGHMYAIVSAINSLTGGSVGYNGSASTIDLDNATAVAFTQALVEKYAAYFRVQGCNEFNMGADEYANDISGNPAFAGLISSGRYGQFADYIQTVSNIIKNAGMVPMAFNDGFYYKTDKNNTSFDSDIMIAYWSSGWSGYDVASASTLVNKGHEMINTNGDFYYVLGKDDKFDSGYDYASNFSASAFMGGTVSSPRGSMFCIWCDYPTAETETEVALKTRLVIRAMGLRMQGQSIDGMDTEKVVEGGFNADGTINGAKAEVSIQVGSGSTALKVGDSVTLSLSDESSAEWTSSDESVISLTAITRAVTASSVTATANKAGTATIQAVVGENKYETTLTVTDADAPVSDETVTLEVGGTETRTQENVNNENNVDTSELDTKVATVTVTGQDAVGASTTYTPASVTCNILISSNSTSWKAVSGYYYKASDGNYYPLYAKRSRDYVVFVGYKYTYTWGYSTTGSTNNVTQIGNTQSTTGTDATPSITVYTKKDVAAVPASTTITFTGVNAGTTYVTVGETTYQIVVNRKTETITAILNQNPITVSVSGALDISQLDTTVATVTVDGNTMTVTAVGEGETSVTVGNTVYTIKVTKEDLSKVSGLTVEYWITNGRPTDSAGNNSFTISAESAYSEDGIPVGAPTNTTKENRTLQYWRSRLLDTSLGNSSTSGTQQQTETEGDDETYSGVAFTKVRYWNGSWAVYTENNEWVNVEGKHQLVAYYLEILPVADELTVMAADWGKKGDGTTSGDYLDPKASCTVSVQVVYEDGTTNPASTTAADLRSRTIAYGYWPAGRGVGTLNLVGLEGYQIWKVEAETGSETYTNSSSTWGSFTVSSFTWDNNAMTVYEGEPVDSYTIHNDANNPSKEGYYQNLMWDENYEAILITVYVKAKPTDDTLKVVYYDEKFGAELYSYNINVKSGVSFINGITPTPGPFAGNAARIDVTGCRITNALGVTQNFQTDLTQVPEAVGKYSSELYSYTGSVISEDGKTLYLYYNINTDALSPMYVVDFGLPIEFPLSDVTKAEETVKSVTVGSKTRYGTLSYDASTKKFTYTPTSVLQTLDVLTITLAFDGGTSATTNVGVMPATTVHYEESFIDFGNGTSGVGGKQELQKKGETAGKYNFGFDQFYEGQNVASNGTQHTLSSIGDSGTFTFTGTGVEVFANCDEKTGWVSVEINNAATNERLYMVFTAVGGTGKAPTSGQKGNFYSLPIVSVQDLAHGTYNVVVRKVIDTASVNIDGIRIFNTVSSSEFADEHEANPSYVEVRDLVLTGYNVINQVTDSQYPSSLVKNIVTQVYEDTGSLNGAIVISNNPSYDSGEDLKDLLDNGPKNELYLWPGQAVTFNLGSITAQVGMKTVKGGAVNASYTIAGKTTSTTINSSTDMFYSIGATGEVTITNTNSENSTDILSITLLKYWGSNSTTSLLAPVTETQVQYALRSLSLYAVDENDPVEPPVDPVDPPVDPVDPEEPDVKYADAELTVSLVDYTGKKLGTASLTANGVVGEVHTFTAQEILAAAKAQMPAGYAFVDESAVKDMTVGYGAPGTVSVQVGKVTTLKVTYIGLFGRKVGTATITKVQTSAGACQFTAAEIRSNAPASARRVIWLTNVSVSAGSERNLIVSVF